MRALCFSLAMLAMPVAAHETFVAPAATAGVGVPLELRLSSTARFPRTETAILPTRIARMSATIGSAAQPLRTGASRPTWLMLETRPATAGMMRVAVELGAKAIALSPAKVDEYFAEIEAGPAVRAAYAALPAPRQWNEFYTKHAKAFVCVASCADVGAAAVPVGHALEFVAADARLGHVILLAGGKPLAGQPVQIVDATGGVTRAQTDVDGRLAVPSMAARPLLLATTVLRPPAKPGSPFTSDFATVWLGEP
jgi:hypothetical protein